MASLNISIGFDFTGLNTRLDKINNTRSNIWEKTATYIEDRIKKQFQTSTDPAGKPWQRLKLVTIMNRRRRGVYHTKPLIVTGKMLRSLNVIRTKDGIKVTMNVPAMYHQHGTRYMPQRKIFPDKKNEAQWSKDIGDFLAKQYTP